MNFYELKWIFFSYIDLQEFWLQPLVVELIEEGSRAYT